MITLLTLVTGSVLPALPCEYVIDFGAAPVPHEYKMVITLEARDGTRLNLPLIVGAKADPNGNRDDLVIFLRNNKWASVAGTGATVIVTGTTNGKATPVKSVSIASEIGIPVTVRWVPLPLKK